MYNEEQLVIINATEPEIVAVAGPGSGKTHTLVGRIANLVKEKKVKPERIVCITFTNAAATELQARLKKTLSAGFMGSVAPTKLGFLGTLHGWMFHCIRKYGSLIKLPKNIAVVDTATSKELIVEIIAEMGWKGSMEDVTKALENVPQIGEKLDPVTGAEAVARAFHLRLIGQGLISFDGILGYGLLLLEHGGAAGPSCGDYLFVDEAQDSGFKDWLIYDVAKFTNKMYVGDPDQCQPSGTMILMSDGSRKPIEQIVVDDKVFGYDRHSKTLIKTATVSQSSKRIYHGILHTITAGHGSTRCTSNHRWLVKWLSGPERKSSLWCTYIMRRGDNFRIGKTKFFRSSGVQDENVIGLSIRLNEERADCGWVLKTHSTEAEATAYEQIMAATYGIPEACFFSASNCRHFTQAVLDEIFSSIPNQLRNATHCLQDHGRELEFPIIDRRHKRTRRTVQEIRACNLLEGVMKIPVVGSDGVAQWMLIKTSSITWRGEVFSLDVKRYHKYVADDLVTCNSIYRFRGADPESFMMTAEDAKTYLLTKNYRSGAVICNAANVFIEHNINRIDKRIEATKEGGEFGFSHYPDEDRQHAAFGSFIETITQHHPKDTIAILCRTNWQAQEFRESLKLRGIKVVMRKRTNVPPDWNKARVAIAFFNNPENDLMAFKMVSMTRGFADADAIRRKSAAASQSINQCVLKIKSPPLETICEQLARMKLDRAAITKVGKLIVALDPGQTLADLSLAMSEVESGNDGVDDNDPGVVVATIHGAKGKEFDHVLLPSWCEPLFPGRSSSGEDLEESRRLAFVAVTRAKQSVLIGAPEQQKFNQHSREPEEMDASRFIGELGCVSGLGCG